MVEGTDLHLPRIMNETPTTVPSPVDALKAAITDRVIHTRILASNDADGNPLWLPLVIIKRRDPGSICVWH